MQMKKLLSTVALSSALVIGIGAVASADGFYSVRLDRNDSERTDRINVRDGLHRLHIENNSRWRDVEYFIEREDRRGDGGGGGGWHPRDWRDGRPGDGRPGDGRPGDGRPGDGRPGDGRPGDGRPGDGRPGDGGPGDGGWGRGDRDVVLEGRLDDGQKLDLKVRLDGRYTIGLRCIERGRDGRDGGRPGNGCDGTLTLVEDGGRR